MDNVKFSALSETQQEYLTRMKVWGYIPNTEIHGNIVDGLKRRGLIEYVSAWPGSYRLTDAGQNVTPMPSDEWIDQRAQEWARCTKSAEAKLRNAEHELLECQRKLRALRELQRNPAN